MFYFLVSFFLPYVIDLASIYVLAYCFLAFILNTNISLTLPLFFSPLYPCLLLLFQAGFLPTLLTCASFILSLTYLSLKLYLSFSLFQFLSFSELGTIFSIVFHTAKYNYFSILLVFQPKGIISALLICFSQLGITISCSRVIQFVEPVC